MSLLSFLIDAPRARWKYRRKNRLVSMPAQTWNFPEGFHWGAASASHQVEGGNDQSDWWRFERQEGKVKEFWTFPEFARQYKSDHWRRFPDDIRRMKQELGLSSYRFGIEWSRVEPREGEFDEVAIARYAEMCALMRANGIRPMVTLFHWVSPDWIWDHANEQETGWYSPKIVDRFERFVRKVVPPLAPYADLWCTLNEPNSYVYGGYAEGVLAPGHRTSDLGLVPIIRHLLQAHARAYRVIKDIQPQSEVGIAHQFCMVEPEQAWNPIAWIIAGQVEQTATWLYPDAIRDGRLVLPTRDLRVHREELPELKGTLDFMGVNYYERLLLTLPGGWDIRRADLLHDHHSPKEIWPQESHPADFLSTLKHITKRYQLPIYITENGRAHSDDREREVFLREHLAAVGYAVEHLKLPIRGYYWWSLLDNQEWANGFLPRMGLYHVDYSTGERTLRDTGKRYAEIIRQRRIAPATAA
jgi:beta-glucosidase